MICIMTLYAPAELTRVILAYGLDYELITEIVLMWLLYLGAIFFIAKVMKVKDA